MFRCTRDKIVVLGVVGICTPLRSPRCTSMVDETGKKQGEGGRSRRQSRPDTRMCSSKPQTMQCTLSLVRQSRVSAQK